MSAAQSYQPDDDALYWHLRAAEFKRAPIYHYDAADDVIPGGGKHNGMIAMFAVVLSWVVVVVLLAVVR